MGWNGIRGGAEGAEARSADEVNPSPFRGAQASGEFSLGNERGALYVPFTWSSSNHGDETLVLRTIGIGIQVR